MKKISLLASILVGAAMSASALDLVHTDFYQEDFRKMGLHSDVLTDGWLTDGIDASPFRNSSWNGDGENPYDLARYFQPKGEDSKIEDYVLLSFEDETYAMCCTSFEPVDGQYPQTDQWMISPEFEITTDDAVLMFSCGQFTYQQWGTGYASFKVLLSEGGTAKEDFKQILQGSQTINSNKVGKTLSTKNYGTRLNGYKGKKVRLAFVVDSKNSGLVGFSNIFVSNYAITVQNNTARTAVPGSSVVVEVNIGMKIPVNCNKAIITLSYDDVKVEKEVTSNFGSTSNSVVYQLVNFKENPIQIGDKPVYYRITILPVYDEGAADYEPEASYFDAVITVPEKFWPNNVVIEEGTATGCGYCPRGIAALEYYVDNYPGTEEFGKAIPIGIHSNMNYPDPMNSGVENYVTGLYKLNATTGLPQAMFNRATRGKDPTALDEFNKEINKQSVYNAKITGIQYPENPKPGDKVNVLFEIRSGFTADKLPLYVACVLTEDNVRGNSSGYGQTNYFYRYSKGSEMSTGYAFINEYLAPFCSKGELGTEHIPFGSMTYNHVARGIWPDFEGQSFGNNWEADTPVAGSISFELPENITGLLADKPGVIDAENLSAIIMVMDPMAKAAGSIVASDIAKFSNARVSVKEISGTVAKAYRSGNIVTVNAPEGSSAEVYSVDGIRQAAFSVNGSASAEVNTNGVLIVRVSTPDGIETIKL